MGEDAMEGYHTLPSQAFSSSVAIAESLYPPQPKPKPKPKPKPRPLELIQPSPS